MANQKWKDDLTDRLCRVLLSLQDVEECYAFLEDICTISELKSLSQRLEVARMLDERHTYEDIVLRTGASTATISRVKRCLNYGADGYKLVLGRVKETMDKDDENGKG